MNMNPVITDFCHIKNNQVFHHGNLVFAAESGDNSRDFIKAAFRNTDAKYPKFFKMDDYSKLGLLATEILMKSKTAYRRTNKNNRNRAVEQPGHPCNRPTVSGDHSV